MKYEHLSIYMYLTTFKQMCAKARVRSSSWGCHPSVMVCGRAVTTATGRRSVAIGVWWVACAWCLMSCCLVLLCACSVSLWFFCQSAHGLCEFVCVGTCIMLQSSPPSSLRPLLLPCLPLLSAGIPVNFVEATLFANLRLKETMSALNLGNNLRLFLFAVLVLCFEVVCFV